MESNSNNQPRKKKTCPRAVTIHLSDWSTFKSFNADTTPKRTSVSKMDYCLIEHVMVSLWHLPNVEICKLDACIYMRAHSYNKTCFEWTAMLLWWGSFSLVNTWQNTTYLDVKYGTNLKIFGKTTPRWTPSAVAMETAMFGAMPRVSLWWSGQLVAKNHSVLQTKRWWAGWKHNRTRAKINRFLQRCLVLMLPKAIKLTVN